MNVTAILDGLVSHALTLGLFERVNQHEPKSAPGNGLTAAVWADEIGPDPESSGLASTSGVVTFLVRLYTSMLSEPQDAIDPQLLSAVDALMTAYSGDFDLSGSARCVDLLGQSGATLSAKAGYLNQDSKIYRVMTITVPVIVNDVWSQHD
jgi:hypothetical protein